MLDVYNHVAVLVILTTTFMILGIPYIISEGMDAIKFGLTTSACVFLAIEFNMWAVWHLTGGW